MRKIVKELLIKKKRIHFLGYLNRGNYRAIVIPFPKESRFKIENKSDLDLFTFDLLVKRKNICKIQYLH
tara:strand:+ start:195 stop:401 length:207 start_codon:yes stop_codon:yes gene_type:complete